MLERFEEFFYLLSLESDNWGVYIHIFKFCPTNSFEIRLISKELIGQNLNI